jgi:glutamate 5-kinase
MKRMGSEFFYLGETIYLKRRRKRVKARLVVKIGSSSLTDKKGGLSETKLSEHVKALSKLKDAGHEVILITSGAVAAGFRALGYPGRPTTLAGKQAAAAVGQGLLMKGYADYFRAQGYLTAQLLLTRHDFSSEEQYKNAFTTLSELLKRGAIPIINENDSVVVDELTFGDNDRLSALVSGLIHADQLIILTDINGVYDANPATTPGAKRFTFLTEVTEDMLSRAGEAGSKLGTGGMHSKLEAAQIALSLGVPSFIGTGTGPNKLLQILSGNGDGTYIGTTLPPRAGMRTKKQWIKLHSEISGQVTIDAGAEEAILNRGKSLLPSGVKTVQGSFQPGDVVEVVSETGDLIGKGQIQYSAAELLKIKGLHSESVKVHTHPHRSEVIHRDNWVTIIKEREHE